MLAGPQGMKEARLRSRMRRRDLWTWFGVSMNLRLVVLGRCWTYVCGVCFAHDDVEDGDVAAVFGGLGGDHLVFWLEESSHDVQDSGLAHRLGGIDVVPCKGCVAGLQEMAARSGDQGGQDADKIVVHVSWVA